MSAASLSHDIGKFGCRGEDAPRTPYLHYYFTWQYLSEQDLPHIAHVAANHSTWDLEFENLPIESLLLIYADFRVRALRDETGKEHTQIYSLADSYSIILSKLANMTPEKHRRYATVYAKLRDFEGLPWPHGASWLTWRCRSLCLCPQKSSRPVYREEAISGLRHLTFDNSLRLMDTFSADASFEQLLEQAKSEKNLQRIRTYLRLFEEYNSYMPRHSKRMTLNFLYELLMHREGDVRRRLPVSWAGFWPTVVPPTARSFPPMRPPPPTPPPSWAILPRRSDCGTRKSSSAFHPGRKISPKHAQRIADNLKVITESLFSVCSDYDAQIMARPLRRLPEAQEEEREALVSALTYVPVSALDPEGLSSLLDTLGGLLQNQDVPLRLTIFRCFQTMLEQDPDLKARLEPVLAQLDAGESFAVAYQRTVLLNQYCGHQDPLPQADTSELFPQQPEKRRPLDSEAGAH